MKKGAFFTCLPNLPEEPEEPEEPEKPEEPIATMLTPLVKNCGQPFPFRADQKNSLYEGAQSATEFCFSSSKGQRQQLFAQGLIFCLLFYQEKSNLKKCSFMTFLYKPSSITKYLVCPTYLKNL